MNIRVSVKNYRCFQDQPAEIELVPGVTTLMGANNAGKTAFLRLFYYCRPLFELFSQQPRDALSLLTGGMGWTPRVGPTTRPIFTNANDRPLEIRIEAVPDGIEPPSTIPIPKAVRFVVERINHTTKALLELPSMQFPEHMELRGSELFCLGERIASLALIRQATGLLANTIYIPAARNIANAGAANSVFDCHFGEAFVRMWRLHQTGDPHYRNEIVQDVVETIRKLAGLRTLAVHASHDEKTLQLQINGKSVLLDDVGTGLSQLLLSLLPTAIGHPAFVLIDEPELGLHPALQIEFMRELERHAGIGVLAATHSYGLARSVSQRIYTVHRTDAGSILAPHQDDAQLPELLGALQYGQFRMLGYDRLLLVEGPNDASIARSVLRMFGGDPRCLAIPLGGGSAIKAGCHNQLAELCRIASKVYALIDSDRSAPGQLANGNARDFADQCKRNNIEVVITERRAMDNYLSASAALKWSDRARALGPYEKHSTALCGWSKADGWRIAEQMSPDEWLATDVGTLLHAIATADPKVPS